MRTWSFHGTRTIGTVLAAVQGDHRELQRMQVAELAAMLHVDDDEVEAGAAEDLDHRRVGDRQPGADDGAAFLELLLEGARAGEDPPAALAVAQSFAFSH